MENAMGRFFLCALLVGSVVMVSACSSGGGDNDCNDGIDNDADGLVDDNDPGCLVNGNAEAPDPDFAACEDGVDNDGDGFIDFPDDPGCAGNGDDDEYDEGTPQCRDGIDNDGDGLVDYPNDPGCFLSLENDETDDCPDGPNCPACSNGQDDDGDGLTDYGDDPGCDQSADDNEFNADPSECGALVEVLPFPSQGEATGTAEAGGNNELISACGGSGQETVYTYEVTDPTSLLITTDFPETTLDTVLYVRSDCRDTDTEIMCNDDTVGTTSTLLIDVEPGVYYIIVDAHNMGSAGNYKVAISEFTPQGGACDVAMPMCAPGLVCRYLDMNATETTCELPSCMDTLDNDGDGLADFPDDPGCTEDVDNDETDDCPDGPNCPECGDGIDNDGDGETDFAGAMPDDGCTSASDDAEIDNCIPGVEVIALDDGGASGTTSGISWFVGSCGFGAQPEDVYAYNLDQDLLSLTFSTEGSALDTVTYVRFGDCGDTMDEIACADPDAGGEDVTINSPELGTYFVFVDGAFSTGSYVLNVSGVIPAGGTCDTASSQFVCSAGYFCDGMTDTCEPTACNDGVDNDMPADGLADWPDDPGCATTSDNDESDDCDDPMPMNCPQCSDGADNDMDMSIDYPDDLGCAFASDDVEEDCVGESDPVEVITTTPTMGTTTGLTHDFAPSCNSTGTAPDKVYVLPVIGQLNSLHIDTIDPGPQQFDSVIYIKSPECTDADLACNDEGPGPFGSSTLDLIDVTPGSYRIFIDGWSSNQGDFVLNISGEIRRDERCDAALVAAGVFQCESGYACDGGFCVVSQCADGVDNDSPLDGLMDFPDDPGCVDDNDNDESDDCPDGVNCPQCSNDMDDDGDGAYDYSGHMAFPADPGCLSAGDDNEIDECIPGIEVQPLPDTGVMDTTPNAQAGSNFNGSCNTSTLSTEDVWGYTLSTDLTSLTFSTVGSADDTVLYVRYDVCDAPASELDCQNQAGGGEEITIANPAQGNYFVFVDGNFASEIGYLLNVSGTIANGGTCDPMSTQFTCESGYVCDVDTCVVAACNDGVDNDTPSDGLMDYPNDPGCDSPSDDDESDDCTTTMMTCPACGDGMDNDSDGLTDYMGNDLGCSAASDDNEANCEDTEPVDPFTMSLHTGSTAAATNDWVPSCSQTSTAPDVVYELNLPGDLNNLTVDTFGSAYDTVLMVREDVCSMGDLSCNDDAQATLQSEIILTNLAAGLYFVVVDGFGANSGNYNLNITGEIGSGQPCDPAQVTAGIVSCVVGETCQDPGSGFVCTP